MNPYFKGFNHRFCIFKVFQQMYGQGLSKAEAMINKTATEGQATSQPEIVEG